MITMTSTLMKAIRSVVGIGFLALVALAGSSPAFAQLDPSLEVFRIRCQIDTDVNPATGLIEPKVQIQAKARADILDGFEVGFLVENISAIPAPLPPNVVYAVFDLGSASADWDTFPDPLDPNLVAEIPGDFVVDGDQIQVHARDTSLFGSGQQVTDVAEWQRPDAKKKKPVECKPGKKEPLAALAFKITSGSEEFFCGLN